MKKTNAIILFSLLLADLANAFGGDPLTQIPDANKSGYTQTYVIGGVSSTRRSVFWVGEEVSIPVECCECIDYDSYTATSTDNKKIDLRIEYNRWLTQDEINEYHLVGEDISGHWRNRQGCYHELVGTATQPGKYSGSIKLTQLATSHFRYRDPQHPTEWGAVEQTDQRTYTTTTVSYSFEVKSLNEAEGTISSPNSKATIVSRDPAASFRLQAELYSYLKNNTNSQQTLNNAFVDYYMTMPNDDEVGVFSIWKLPENSCVQVIECGNNNYVFRNIYLGPRTLEAGESLGEFQLALSEAPSTRTNNLKWFDDMKEKTTEYDVNEDYSYLYPAESHNHSAARYLHYNYKMASFENNGTLLYGSYPSWLNSSCHIIQPKERVDGEHSRIQYRATSQENLRLCSDNVAIIPDNPTPSNLTVQFQDAELNQSHTGYFNFRIVNGGTNDVNLNGYQLRFFYGGTSYDPSRVKYYVRAGNPAGQWSAERCRDDMYVLKINLTSNAQIKAGEYYPGDNQWRMLFEASVDSWDSGFDLEKNKMFSWKNTSTFIDNENIGLFDPNGKQVYGRGDLPSCDGGNNGGDNGGDNGGGNGGGNGGDNGGDNGNDVVTNSNLKAQFFDQMRSTKEMGQLLFRISNTGTEDVSVNGYEMWFYYGGKESVNVSDLNFSLWDANLASASTTKCSDNEYVLKVKINNGVAKAGGSFPEYDGNYIGMNVQKNNGWSDIGKSSWHSWSDVTVISDNPKMTLYDEKGNYVSGEKGYKCGQSDQSSEEDEKNKQEYKYKHLTIQFQDSDGKKKTNYGDFKFQINNTGAEDYAIGNYEMRFFFESKKDQFDASEIKFISGNIVNSNVTKEWCGDGKYFLKIKLATDAVVKANNHFPEYYPINVFTIRTSRENEGNYLEYFKNDLFSWDESTVMIDNEKMGLFDASGNHIWGYPGYKCEHPITVTPGSIIDASRFSVEETVQLLPFTFYDEDKKQNITLQNGVNEVSLKIKNVSEIDEPGPVFVDYFITHAVGQNPLFCYSKGNKCFEASSSGNVELSRADVEIPLRDGLSVVRRSTGNKHVYRFILENGLRPKGTVEFKFSLRDECANCLIEDPEPGPYIMLKPGEMICKAIEDEGLEAPDGCDAEWDPTKYFIWKLEDDWSAEFGETSTYVKTERVVIYSKDEEVLYGQGDGEDPKYKNPGGYVPIPRITVQDQFPNRTDAIAYSGGQMLSNGGFEELSLVGWDLKSGTANSIRGATIQGSRYLKLSGQICQDIPESALEILSDSASVLTFWYKVDEGCVNPSDCKFTVNVGNASYDFIASDKWQHRSIFNAKKQLNDNEKSICITSNSEVSFDDFTLVPNTFDQPSTYAVRLTTTQHEELETRAYDNDRDSVIVTSSKRDAMGRNRYKYLPFKLACFDAENCNADPVTLSYPDMAQEFYNGRPGYTDAQGFPYKETIWKPDQVASKDVEGAPGKAFSLDDKVKEHHVVRSYSSGVNLTDVDLMDFTSLSDAVSAKRNCRVYAEKECKDDGSSDDNDYNYHAAKDNDPTHTWEMNLDQNGNASFVVKDGEDHVIVSGALKKTGKTGKDQIIYELVNRSVNELDARGNVIKSHSPLSCAYSKATQNCVDPSTYDYDEQSRMISSWEPDAGTSRTYYDLAGRVRATQSQNQISAKTASVMIYDHLDRVIATGEWKHNKDEKTLRAALLSDETVNANKGNFPKEEDLTPGTITRTFYDKVPTPDTLQFLGVDIAPSGVTFNNTRGRVTAVISDVRAVFNTDGSAKKATSGADSVIRVSSANSYDKYGRILASYAFDPTVPVDSLNMLATETEYDLGGKVLTVTKYPYGLTENAKKRKVIETYRYDRLGRVYAIFAKNGANPENAIATYEYLPTGALKSVKMGGGSLTLNYTYHISGAVKTAVIESAMHDKLYSETLYYEDCGDGECSPQYNGNISRMIHNLAHDNQQYDTQRDVQYTYDMLNRLIEVADSKQPIFDEMFEYDVQGRITAQRRAQKSGQNNEYKVGSTGGEYTYDSKNKSNRLISVADDMGGSADTRKMSATDNFDYDLEGNLTNDKSKGLTITYNWRSMPIEFVREKGLDKPTKLLMSYDGTGRRVSKTVLTKNDAGEWETVSITHYTGIGTEIRENLSTADHETKVVVNMPQGLGRYEIESASVPANVYVSRTFEWFLKNHLGSTMLVYASGYQTPGTVMAAYDYRAFGEQIELRPSSSGKITENFTGKERDDEIELNYFGARYLDPMLGMWTSVDPARQFASPYLYAGNGMNPVNVVDPDGNFLMMGEGQSEEFHDNVTIAIDYLNAYGAAGEIASLHAKDQVIYLKETSKGSYFDPDEMTIYWNPHDAAEAQTKLSFQSDFQAVSPALLLVHESAHANHFIKNPSEYNRLANKGLSPDGKFGNGEERRTILNSEWPAAKKLGEGLRGSWYGRGFYVSDPTQNRRGE